MAESDLERQYSGREVFDAIYDALTNSDIVHRIRQRAYGDEYPADAEPFSALLRTELEWFVQELGVGRGSRLLDVACGRGGAGLWVARATGARLTGIDWSMTAVTQAAARGHGSADFAVCDAARIAVTSESHDAAMCVDSLQLMRERQLVVGEVRRVLRRGGRFVLSTWESRERPRPGVTPRILHDHGALISAAGLRLIERREPPGWHARQLAYFEEVAVHGAVLMAELGEPVARRLLAEASQLPARLASWRKVVLICERR